MNNKFLVAVSIFLCAGMAFLFTEVQSLKQERNNLSNQITNQRNNNQTQGEPEKDPYLTRQVKNTIMKRAKALQACYKSFLQISPKVTSGMVKLDWQVIADGKVTGAGVVRNDLQNESFGNCIVTEIESIKFPPPPSGRSKYIEHSLHFKDEAALEQDKKDRKAGPLVQLKK